MTEAVVRRAFVPVGGPNSIDPAERKLWRLFLKNPFMAYMQKHVRYEAEIERESARWADDGGSLEYE